MGQGQPGGPCSGQKTNILQRFDAQPSTAPGLPRPPRPVCSPTDHSQTNTYIGPVIADIFISNFTSFTMAIIIIGIVFHHWWVLLD